MTTRFDNYSAEEIFCLACDAAREARGLRADAKASCKSAGAYFAEFYRRVGAEVFWARVEHAGRKVAATKVLLRLAGWEDPEPTEPKAGRESDYLEALLRLLNRRWPALSPENRITVANHVKTLARASEVAGFVRTVESAREVAAMRDPSLLDMFKVP